jgi:serine/threonine protein kinase
MTEVWTKWEGEVINGAFPLRRFLGCSDHSGVFLTEYKVQNLPDAAIKIVPADSATAGAQLSRWGLAASLSHPHLVRLLDRGRCKLGDREFLFLVMEYAEQTLSQILPHRALTPDEAMEMLLPTLEALAFLHRKNLVQGQLKPSNFLVVDDRLKLASDTIRPAGVSLSGIAKSSLYHPPEAKSGRISPAADIWTLGISMIEALTQRPPALPEEGSETASLPASIPPAFAQTLQRCLSPNPADRPTVGDLETRYRQTPQAAVVSIPQQSPRQRWFVPAVAVLLILSAAVWAGWHLFRSNINSRQSAADTSEAASQNPRTKEPASPAVSQPVLSRPVVPAPDASLPVLHEEIPDVSRSASGTIHGHIIVAVRVSVDRSGNVVGETLENPGPSKYFARLATVAAGKWTFAPAENAESREWLVQFDFTRGGTTGHAAATGHSATPRP